MKTLFNILIPILATAGFLFIIWYCYPPFHEAQAATISSDALPDASGVSFIDVVNAHCDGDINCEVTMILNDEGIK